jgi:hypothetical protein
MVVVVSTSARGHERLSAQVPVEGRSVRQAGKALLKERYIGSPSAEPVCSRTMRSEEGKRAISTRRQPALELGAVIFVVWSSNKVTRITAKPPGLSSRHDSYATQRNLTIAATTSRTAPVNSIASSYASSPKPLHKSTMGGFDFSNHNRNAALHAQGVPLPKATSTGTTIVGCLFDGGVVIAADTRATSGPIVADKVH